MDRRRWKINAVVQARVNRALRSDHEALLRWLNFRGPTYGSTSHLLELYRRDGVLPTEFALQWALSESVGALRNLARRLIAAGGKKDSMPVRQEFCDRLRQLLKDDVAVVGDEPTVLWSREQMEDIIEYEQWLAPRLLIGLWEADPELRKRLRECAFPQCNRWFVDDSTRHPKRFCRSGHRVRMSERVAPLKRAITAALPQKRRVWVSLDDLAASVMPEARIGFRRFVRQRSRHPTDQLPDREHEAAHLASTYFTAAVSSLLAEGRLEHRTVDART